MSFYIAKQLLETQRTDGVDSSMLRCKSKTIDEPCTLQPGYTWNKLRASPRIFLVRGKDHGRPAWHYVFIVDDDDIKQAFLAKVATGSLDVANYGQILRSGWGEKPPSEVTDKIEKEYLLSYNC